MTRFDSIIDWWILVRNMTQWATNDDISSFVCSVCVCACLLQGKKEEEEEREILFFSFSLLSSIRQITRREEDVATRISNMSPIHCRRSNVRMEIRWKKCCLVSFSIKSVNCIWFVNIVKSSRVETKASKSYEMNLLPTNRVWSVNWRKNVCICQGWFLPS